VERRWAVPAGGLVHSGDAVLASNAVNNNNAAWPDDMVTKLRALWTEGLPIIEIGLRLGVSPNAVVGKAHRAGCEARPSPIKRGHAPKPRAPRMRKEVSLAPMPSLFEQLVSEIVAPPEPVLVSPPVPLRAASLCQWILSTGRPHVWCDKPAGRGAWCDKHYAVCYIPWARRQENPWAPRYE
jgi:GcrA cell cycle regulator